MDPTRTYFGDLRQQAVRVFRVQTEGGSTYVIAFHEEARGRKYVVVRGQPGTDRENLVVRDSDPRIGDASLFDVPHTDWVGKQLEIATMTTSTVVAAHREGEQPKVPAGSVKVAGPPGLGDAPRIVPMHARGTSVGNPRPAPHDLARQLVVGQDPLAGAPYPMRHVLYAEDVVTRLRSICRRDRLFQDIAHDPELKHRYTRALTEAAAMLEELRARAK
jgi:hypothetical protein